MFSAPSVQGWRWHHGSPPPPHRWHHARQQKSDIAYKKRIRCVGDAIYPRQGVVTDVQPCKVDPQGGELAYCPSESMTFAKTRLDEDPLPNAAQTHAVSRIEAGSEWGRRKFGAVNV